MAVSKAVLITNQNKDYLEGRFGTGDPYDKTFTVALIGMWYLLPFDSQDGPGDILSLATLKQSYRFTGKVLRNGFYEVERR